MHLEVAAITHPGRVREHNEDAFLAASLDGPQRVSAREIEAARRSATFPLGPRGVIVAISDGMGGAAAGELASSLSLTALYDELMGNGKDEVRERLRRVVLRASRRVHDEGVRRHREGMGATLTAALVDGEAAHVAQVGDSRAYLFRDDGVLRQVTHDQSYVQVLVDAGVISAAEAARSPLRSVILEAMGSVQDPKVEVGDVALSLGDRLLLCSDGLTTAVAHDRIAALLASHRDLRELCSELLAAAIDGGAPDNVTVVLARLNA